MCTYETATLPISGSGKIAGEWVPVTDATVYFDHPVHAPETHTLNIDFRNPSRGASCRLAVELSRESAQALARAIDAMLLTDPDRQQEHSPEGSLASSSPEGKVR